MWMLFAQTELTAFCAAATSLIVVVAAILQTWYLQWRTKIAKADAEAKTQEIADNLKRKTDDAAALLARKTEITAAKVEEAKAAAVAVKDTVANGVTDSLAKIEAVVSKHAEALEAHMASDAEQFGKLHQGQDAIVAAIKGLRDDLPGTP